MKKHMMLGLLLTGALFAGGCATSLPMGSLYTEVAFPGGAGNGDVAYSKVGTAKTNSYFGLIATGDGSIEAAVKNGGIRTIKYVDYHSKNILGIIGEYTTTVYGD